MLNTILIIVCLLVMVYGLGQVISGIQQIGQKAQELTEKVQSTVSRADETIDRVQGVQETYEDLPETIIPRGASQVGGNLGRDSHGESVSLRGGNVPTTPAAPITSTVGESLGNQNPVVSAVGTTISDQTPLSTGTTVVGTVGEQLTDTRIGSGQPALGNQDLPVGAPVRSFVEFGEVAGAHPKDIWLDNVALTIPPSNVGTTDIVFVDAGRPQQCYQKCKNSPFCRFFSYWKETGVCNMHQTLQNGETTPENMIRYAYTTPFSQHWVSGYVRKSGSLIPPNQL